MPKLPLTPELTAQFNTILTARRTKAISKEVYEAARDKILRKQEGINKRNATMEKKKEAKQAAKRAADFKKRAAVREVKLIKKNTIASQKIDNIFTDLWELWKAIKGMTGTIRVIGSNFDRTMKVPSTFNLFMLKLSNGGGSPPELAFNEGETIVIQKQSAVAPKAIHQLYADGVNHCVFDPLIAYLDDKATSTKADKKRRDYKRRSVALAEMRDKYVAGVEREVQDWDDDGYGFITQKRLSHGVPIDEFEAIAKMANVKLTINDWLGQGLHVFNKNGRFAVEFTNTRRDHLTFGNMDATVFNSESIELSAVAMKAKWDEYFLDHHKDFIVYGIPRDGEILRLITPEGCFARETPDKEVFDSMNELVRRKHIALDATRRPDVNAFVKQAVNTMSIPMKLNDFEAEKHLDMPKAYAQFKKCRLYSGFLGAIQQIRSGPFTLDFVREHVGIYQVRLGAVGDLAREGIQHGQVKTVISPELLQWAEMGVEMEVLSGCWGTQFDFEFPPEMFEKMKANPITDKRPVSRYAYWVGNLGREDHETHYTFRADDMWAAHLKSQHGEESVMYWKEGGLATVSVPRKGHVMTWHHLYAFVLGYLRIQMRDAMRAVGYDNVCAVATDALFIRGDTPAALSWFREKPMPKLEYFSPWWDRNDDVMEFPPLAAYGMRNTLLTGQGGAGKTYGFMMDKGFVNPLFVGPEHALLHDVHDKYGCPTITAHRLVGVECQSSQEKGEADPSIIFADEITKWNPDWIEKMFKLYPSTLIVLAGDADVLPDGRLFNYQIGNMAGEPWEAHDVVIHEVLGDRRSVVGDPLIQLKMDMRAQMRKVMSGLGDGGLEMAMWLASQLTLVSQADAVKQFAEGDIWIASTHAKNAELLEAGVVSGWRQSGRGLASRLSFTEQEGWEKRGAFTIHSFQGMTVEGKRLFITLEKMFDPTMGYTAISRVRRLDQIVLVTD